MRDEEAMVGSDLFFRYKGKNVSGIVLESFNDLLTVQLYETGETIVIGNPFSSKYWAKWEIEEPEH